jgi:hypothetical protein
VSEPTEVTDGPMLTASGPGRARSRTAAVWLAAAAAVLEFAAFVLWLVESAGLPASLALGLIVSPPVTAAGAWLLHLGDERGTAVLAAAGLLTVPALVASGPNLTGAPTSSWLWFVAAGTLLLAAALAWTGRDRGGWDQGPPTTSPLFVVAAVAVLVGTVLPTTWFRSEVAPGADGWWRPVLWEQGLSVSTFSLLLAPVVVGLVLWGASAVARPVGAGLVGALAVTGLAAAVGNAWFVAGAPDLWFTPFGWADLVGNLVLLGFAVRWWAPAPHAGPVDHPRTG